MTKILFICYGNICRSVMAEFVMKDLIKKQNIEKDFYIESAAVSTEEIGNHIYPLAKDCLYRHGIHNKEINEKRARQLTKKDYQEFDYLIIAEESNRRMALKLVGEDVDNKINKLLDFAEDSDLRDQDIDDPWYTRNFDKAYNDIVAGCKGLLKYLQEKYINDFY